FPSNLRNDLYHALLQSARQLSFFFSSRRRHTRSKRDWSSDVCSSDLEAKPHDECAERREEVQSEPLGSDSEYPSGHSIQSQEILREEAYMGYDKEERECSFTAACDELVSKNLRIPAYEPCKTR